MNIETANRLLQLRKTNNLSQEALAEKLSVSRQAVSKWERAEASPDTDNLIALAKLYGVSLDQLLNVGLEQSAEAGMQEDQSNHPTRHGTASRDGHKEKILVLGGPFAALITIVFIIIGLATKVWDPTWLLFLLIPLWYSLTRAIKRKNANHFAYPVVTVILFILCGYYLHAWGTAWVVFLTIPIYYGIAQYLKTRKQE